MFFLCFSYVFYCFPMFSPQVARWVSGLVPQAVDGALDGQLGKDVVVGLPGTSPKYHCTPL
jgi:hypothetical protein